MEIVDGEVYYIRKSRTQPGLETVHVIVDSTDGFDDRMFAFHLEPGLYARKDKVTLEVNDVEARIILPPATD